MKTLLLFFLFAPLLLWAKPEIIKPKVKTPTSFAIVVDKQSYDRVKSSIEAYRDAIERDGLANVMVTAMDMVKTQKDKYLNIYEL